MLQVSIAKRSIDVVIQDENGVEVKYKLRQMTGAEADEYRACKAGKIELDKEGNVTRILDYSGQYLDLLTRTLIGPDGSNVPRSVLESWPDEALRALYESSAKLNKLVEDEDEETDPKKS